MISSAVRAADQTPTSANDPSKLKLVPKTPILIWLIPVKFTFVVFVPWLDPFRNNSCDVADATVVQAWFHAFNEGAVVPVIVG